LAALRTELAYILQGTLFLFFGSAALTIAAIRERREVRILIWLGIWSGMYGFNLLVRSPAVLTALPHAIRIAIPFATRVCGFLFLVIGLLAWSELTVGKLRLFTQVMAIPSAAVAVVGIGLYLVNGSGYQMEPYNNFLAAIASVVLAMVVSVPKLSARFLTYGSRILTVGALAFAIDALYRNLSGVLHLPSQSSPFWDDLVFAGFLLSFAYVAARKVFANERRLLSIENELDIARQIQASILPTSVPEIEHLRIVATYQPMAAVGGDFYAFIPVDRNRIGFLVADVSGHGVPAALIASMIKIGVQSVVPCAADPGEVLRRLNRILSGQLRGVLVSAAYLWVDMEARTALYSAAGHPPLLCWRGAGMMPIESNGLLIGVLQDAVYPVREMCLQTGDRFLLCTDGVLEPENAAGVAFGEQELEKVVRENQRGSAAELSGEILSGIRRWQPASTAQQDDITLLVIDVA
jgi:sigma-B regulation protein RsbU (phosphoserine phosphatase)